MQGQAQKNKRVRYGGGKVILNDGQPSRDIAPKEICSSLKTSLNMLKARFLDIERGRIAYERMRDSTEYAEYVQMANLLKNCRNFRQARRGLQAEAAA